MRHRPCSVKVVSLEKTKYDFPVNPSDPNSLSTWVIQRIRPGDRVLEIGCATGSLLAYLRDLGCDVLGIEVDPDAGRIAREKGLEIIEADIENGAWMDRVPGPYDAIILADVLEHLREPEKTLKRTAEILSDKGRVYLSVPNVAHWSARRNHLLGRFEYRDLGLMDRTHLRFFTYDTLKELVRTSGFKVKSQTITANYNTLGDTTFWLLSPFYRSKSVREFIVNWIERPLAAIWPRMFAYQFVMELVPRESCPQS